MPVPLLLAWILSTPFVVMGVVEESATARRVLGRWHGAALVAGSTGFALVAVGAFVIGGSAGYAAMAVGAPLLGLCVWVRDGRGDGGETQQPEPDPGEPPEEVDWDRFMRDLAEWSAARAPTRIGS